MRLVATIFRNTEILLLVAVTLTHWLFWLHWRKQARAQGSPYRRLVKLAVGLSLCWASISIIGNLRPVAMRFETGPTATWIKGMGELWGITVGAALTLYLIVVNLEQRYKPERREFLDAARTAILAAPAVFTAYGTGIGRSDYEMKEIDIRIPGLHKDLQGLRILHLSDIHLSPFLSERELARVIDMGNEARAKLCVVTGDFITNGLDPLEACMDQLARIRCEAGVLGCNGNHEIFARAEERTRQLGGARGMRILRDETAVLRFGDARLNIAGVDYQRFHEPYLVHTARHKQEGMVNLLLSHNPDVFPVAAKQGWDLTLAGHTHGGQITVEILHQWANVARMFTPYVSGKYEQDGKSLYVTRGIGTVGVPARVGAPPEVSIIRLCAS
ncbi:MAG: metallophosphoesterase [Bryobacterales bacterium]|nr:metallophosphoesterase [Bryobacterales bacterium]